MKLAPVCRQLLNSSRCRFGILLVLILFAWQSTFAQNYSEAPVLAEQVAAGELPPVQERLPENPVVVPVVERIGEYGGTWRTALVGPNLAKGAILANYPDHSAGNASHRFGNLV